MEAQTEAMGMIALTQALPDLQKRMGVLRGLRRGVWADVARQPGALPRRTL